MHYLDASAIVAALTEESATERIRRWLGEQSEGTLALSRWVLAETSSALSLKVRTGALPLEQRNAVLAGWRVMTKEVFRIIAMSANDFDMATAMVEQHDLGLRAGDALHIAITRGTGCTLVTLDRRMATAATALGVPVADI